MLILQILPERPTPKPKPNHATPSEEGINSMGGAAADWADDAGCEVSLRIRATGVWNH